MANAMIITGPVVLIQLKLTTSWVNPTQPNTYGDRTTDQVIMDVWSDSEVPDDVRRKLDNAKAELTGICRTALRSADVEVTQLTLRSGSLEVLAVLTATKYIAEFGAVMQGVREIIRLIPEPVIRFVRDLAGSSSAAVEVTVTETPRAEMQSGMLSATPAAELAPVDGRSHRRRRGRGSRRERSSVPPPSNARAPVSDAPLLSDQRLTTYLLASHAVLTLTLLASVVYLVLGRS